MSGGSGPIEFIDLKAQGARIRADVDARIARVLDHGAYILGPEVAELERRLEAFAGARHCVTVANGTDALLMPLLAWGVGRGDAVIVPAFTFMATAEVVSLAGATPVFADVDARTFNLDAPSLERALAAARAAGLRPRGVIPVDLFGQLADYPSLREIASREGLFVLQDAAQSFGAARDGARAGTQGDVAATSFFPAKPLGCYGDGGALFCADADLAARLASIRVHGKGSDKYDNVRIGMNARLDTIQAAVLLAKLEIFDEELAARRRVAARYTAALSALGPAAPLPPRILPGVDGAWAQYSVLCASAAERARLREGLERRGVPTQIYYPRPLHLQTAYASLGYREGDLPTSEDIARRIVSLPMHPYLDAATQDRILAAIGEVIAEGAAARGSGNGR